LERLALLIQRPAYDPASVTSGIVHLGVGGFHRAHMARLTHDLMQIYPEALSWGIVGAGLLPGDRMMHDALKPQDGLYTLVERSGETEDVTIVGSICELIYAADDPKALLDAIDRPGTKIVSLTVTENGYCLNPATKRLDPNHGMIAGDLADPERPRSAIGVITEAFRRRMVSGRAAFTALSCDNIQHNGRVLRDAVLAFATLRDPKLAEWIRTHGRFPSTMVDRVTPATQPEDTAELAARYGVIDNWPVFSETFIQWVIEDDFADGRPSWEEVGVQFVDDVAPYEFMKLRLLNASHLAVAGLGRLAGYQYIHEAMNDPRLRRYMRALMDRETGPTLPAIQGIDLATYKATLVERFANPSIRDTVERVNTDAPLNILVDPIRDRLWDGKSVDLLGLALAAWLRRMRGIDETGQPIDIRHPFADLLREKAIEGGDDPRPMLSIDPLFGDLVANEQLVETVQKWLTSLYSVGAVETLETAQGEQKF
jgi:mannitol-1-phosphate/altronate dehydrogenase